LRARADAGHSWAALRLAELLAGRGDIDAAATLLRERADAGDSWAAFRLADLLAKQSNAEALLLTEIQVGKSEHAAAAWFRLLEHSENPADRIRARRVRRSGLTPPAL
jgi:predicted negative regulator of RcsB-dependent stress response